MKFVAVREYAGHHLVYFVIQRGIVAGAADIDAVSRPRKLKIVDRRVADGRCDFRYRHFAWLVPRVGKGRVVAVSPQPGGLIRVKRVKPGVLRKFEHQGGLLRNVPVAANILFAPIDRNADLVYPILPLGIWCAEVRQCYGRQVCLACRAETAGRDNVTRKRLAGCRISWGGSANRVREIASKLRRRGYAVVMNSAAALAVPFFRPKEIYSVLLNRTADGVTEIVAAQQLFLAAGVAWHSAAALEEEILGIQKVVTAEVVDVAMVLVASALGYHVDLCAACAAKFGSVAIALDLEFIDAINGRVNKNGALRADIVVPRAIHCPLVVHRGRTAEGNIHTSEQTLVLVVEAFAHRRAGNERGQLHEIPAVHGQFANLLASHDVSHVPSRRIYNERAGFHLHDFRGCSHLHLHVEVSYIGNVQLHVLLC